MQADRPGQDDHVTRATTGRRRGRVRGPDPHAGGGDEQAVGRTAVHNLGVPADDRHADRGRGGAGGAEHVAQLLQRQALLDNEGQGERPRLCAHHRQVVHRAVDSQRPDVAAGKHDRFHHERIGADHGCHAVQLDHCGVLEDGSIPGGIQRRHDELAQQFGRELTAGSVSEQHSLGFGERDRAGRLERIGDCHRDVTRTPRERPPPAPCQPAPRPPARRPAPGVVPH